MSAMFYPGIAWLLGVAVLPVAHTRPPADARTACTRRERLSSRQGIITSPNFPGPYAANLSCTWVITTPEGTTLSLNFSTFDVTSGDCKRRPCGCDYVQVKGQSSSTQMQFRTKYCNDNKPSAVYLPTNKVRLHFRTDAANQGSGFSLTYTSRDAVVKETPASGKALIARDLPANTTQSSRISTDHAITTRSGEEERTTSSNFNITPVTLPTHFSPSFSNGSNKISGGQKTEPNFKPSVMTIMSTAHAPPDVILRSTAGNVSVVFFVEEEEEEEAVNDIVVLGPSLPIIFIFIAGVVGIAWWNFISDRQEYNRFDRYGRFWKYFQRDRSKNHPPESRGAVQTSASFSKKKRRDSMREVRTHNLYTDMMRNWKGQAAAAKLTPYQPYRRVARHNSFAGRLTSTRETIRDPSKTGSHFVSPEAAGSSTSRPVSSTGDLRTVDKPVQTGQEAGPTSPLVPKTPPAASTTPSSSRPPSVLLKEALALLFSTIDPVEADKKGDSKAESKRVSFAIEQSNPSTPRESDMKPEEVPLLQHDENQEHPALSVDARPLKIPSIVVEQPSVSSLEATPETLSNADQLNLLDPRRAATSAQETDSDLRKDEIIPDLEDFLLNLDKDLSLDDPPYSCAHHVRDILRQSYGAADEPDSLSWEVLRVPDEFLEMIRSPQHRQQFEAVEEVD